MFTANILWVFLISSDFSVNFSSIILLLFIFIHVECNNYGKPLFVSISENGSVPVSPPSENKSTLKKYVGYFCFYSFDFLRLFVIQHVGKYFEHSA